MERAWTPNTFHLGSLSVLAEVCLYEQKFLCTLILFYKERLKILYSQGVLNFY